MNKVLITSYTNPDVDGVSCAFAYAELLQKQGQDAIAGIFGTPHPEAQFVLDKFNIGKIVNAELLLEKYSNIIFVDASDLNALPTQIRPEQIVEIIDHRKLNETEKFFNAKTQIELVGSCATLIAEKFYQQKVAISKESAVLLYSAIVSNTINFKSNITTDRDKTMAEWLKIQIVLPENYIEAMFQHKSNFTKPIKEAVLGDMKILTTDKYKVCIGQLEIVAVENFINNNLDEIKKALVEIKQEKSADYIYLSCIDLDLAKNFFVTVDENSEKLLENSINISFQDSVAHTDNIIMRKVLSPMIKEYLEK